MLEQVLERDVLRGGGGGGGRAAAAAVGGGRRRADLLFLLVDEAAAVAGVGEDRQGRALREAVHQVPEIHVCKTHSFFPTVMRMFTAKELGR